MQTFFNKKTLILIPIIFLIVIIFRISYDYNSLVENERNFARAEAEVLNDYAVSHRMYYQKLFIDKVLPLNGNTLVALPAYSSRPISKEFSEKNIFKITARIVSDKARNRLNNADEDELKAIEYFKKNENENKYFIDENPEYYQYASVLRIEKKCLTCHGSKEKAPKFIQEKYDKAYDYKLGEVRGLISIKVPKESVRVYFFKSFIESIIYDAVLLMFLFLGISYLIRKIKKINSVLAKEVSVKTTELRKTLLIDTLTKLPNRRQLMEDITMVGRLALLNVDAFKDINDFYGHSAGDKILKDIAVVLEKSCMEGSVYKLPSDEFAIYSTKDSSQSEFIKIVNEVIKVIQKIEFKVDGNSVFIILSCGIASNEEYLLSMADIALKEAKRDNMNLVVYDETLDISKKVIENSQNITLLRNAIENDNIVPFFQPIYNLSTQKIEKYECLVRIVQDDGTVIPPFKFLDIAVKSKQYLHITKIMITKSFEFFKDKDYEFSINLSIIDMINDDMLNFIIEKLENFKDPHRVVFEILENEKFGNYNEIKKFIEIIKKFGCKFAIDDFGSGYSNFAHVYELNVDYIKIDSSLVKYVNTDENSRIITKTIINFSSNLGLKTIAEYVEDKESLDLLKKMGVNYIQGYYIGKPDPELNTTYLG